MTEVLTNNKNYITMKERKDYGIRLGDTIRILKAEGRVSAELYVGKVGIVRKIDSKGQLHGTWGGLAVIPGVDTIVIVQRVLDPSLPEEVIGGGPSPSRQKHAGLSGGIVAMTD